MSSDQTEVLADTTGTTDESKMSEEDVEQPFSKAPFQQYSLPCTIYSSAIIVPFNATYAEYKLESLGTAIFAWLKLIPHWALVFGCMFAQAVFITYIQDITKENIEERGEDICPSSGLLQVAGGVVFTAVIYADIIETVVMVMFLYHFPRADRHQVLSLKEIKPGEPKKIVSGMTRLYKWFTFFMLLLPKFAIALSLMYYGYEFIITSETNEDLILNTLAMTFVLEIDEIMFTACVPTYIQTIITEELPALPHWSELDQSLHAKSVGALVTLFGPYINLVFIVGFVFGLDDAFCMREEE